MELMEIRRGLMGAMSGGSINVREMIVTIPENSWNRSSHVAEFFISSVQNPIAILKIEPLDAPTVNNEFYSYDYGYEVGYRVDCAKWQNSQRAYLPWNDPAYLCYAVQGARYKITYIA